MVMTSKWIAAAVAAVAFASLAFAQSDLNPKNRQELKREDVPGTNMEIFISVVEAQPSELLARHIHHGEEAYYVLQGATVETPDGKQNKVPTGVAGVNHRDVPHSELRSLATRLLAFDGPYCGQRTPTLRRTSEVELLSNLCVFLAWNRRPVPRLGVAGI